MCLINIIFPADTAAQLIHKLDLAPGGYEIARADILDMPEHHMMLGYVKNRQPGARLDPGPKVKFRGGGGGVIYE